MAWSGGARNIHHPICSGQAIGAPDMQAAREQFWLTREPGLVDLTKPSNRASLTFNLLFGYLLPVRLRKLNVLRSRPKFKCWCCKVSNIAVGNFQLRLLNAANRMGPWPPFSRQEYLIGKVGDTKHGEADRYNVEADIYRSHNAVYKDPSPALVWDIYQYHNW